MLHESILVPLSRDALLCHGIEGALHLADLGILSTVVARWFPGVDDGVVLVLGEDPESAGFVLYFILLLGSPLGEECFVGVVGGVGEGVARAAGGEGGVSGEFVVSLTVGDGDEIGVVIPDEAVGCWGWVGVVVILIDGDCDLVGLGFNLHPHILPLDRDYYVVTNPLHHDLEGGYGGLELGVLGGRPLVLGHPGVIVGGFDGHARVNHQLSYLGWDGELAAVHPDGCEFVFVDFVVGGLFHVFFRLVFLGVRFVFVTVQDGHGTG